MTSTILLRLRIPNTQAAASPSWKLSCFFPVRLSQDSLSRAACWKLAACGILGRYRSPWIVNFLVTVVQIFILKQSGSAAKSCVPVAIQVFLKHAVCTSSFLHQNKEAGMIHNSYWDWFLKLECLSWLWKNPPAAEEFLLRGKTNKKLWLSYLTAAVEALLEVRGVVGHPVTLPCTYPVSHGISPMCWGRLARFPDKCKNGVILTNGYNISYKRNKRYHLKGPLLQGNVSLTIEEVTESDSGFYCCRVGMKEWDAVLIISLIVHPESNPAQNPPTIMTRRFYIGISITLLFFLLASTVVITRMGQHSDFPTFVSELVPKEPLIIDCLKGSLEDAFIVKVGKNAYLPCGYNLPAYGTPVPVCWDKGPCPSSRCVNWVLSTDERNVIHQKSRRYQLKRNFLKGDVFLTIENVTLADRGTYCCRVQFPGLGNDKKVNVKLDIRPAPDSEPSR
ncbi:hypothetical protein ACRRTK_006620 [Alexandromys fortis]